MGFFNSQFFCFVIQLFFNMVNSSSSSSIEVCNNIHGAKSFLMNLCTFEIHESDAIFIIFLCMIFFSMSSNKRPFGTS